MFNKSQIMKEAHKRTRNEMRDFPVLYDGYSYAAVLAMCLRGVWKDAKLGRFDAPVNPRREQIRNDITRLQMKTWLTAADFARWGELSHELRSAA
ncbi:hypothetical protein [uncultured Roseibium sp.]|uniref:hypothetical protein n=1 Tax=uncultured Roseibium sp. TaxID=1936171 RepID=UPI00261B4207|nr:hypothetical protein [uncultured Roseibium sp.]